MHLRPQVYLDSAELSDLRRLFDEGVHLCDTVVLLATKDCLTRPWVLLEMWECAQKGIPVIIFPIVGKQCVSSPIAHSP